MDKNISVNSVIVQKLGLDATEMDGEIVMMDLNKGKYYSFNSVGSRIWQLVEKPFSVNALISVLLEEFNVDEKTCEDTVLDFLNKVYNDELISIA